MIVTILIIIAGLALLCFASVVLFGAPYLPTLRPQVHAALELANLKPGETLLELGCGDGKVLIAAAQVGVKSVGYELKPNTSVHSLAADSALPPARYGHLWRLLEG